MIAKLRAGCAFDAKQFINHHIILLHFQQGSFHLITLFPFYSYLSDGAKRYRTCTVHVHNVMYMYRYMHVQCMSRCIHMYSYFPAKSYSAIAAALLVTTRTSTTNAISWCVLTPQQKFTQASLSCDGGWETAIEDNQWKVVCALIARTQCLYRAKKTLFWRRVS